ncbi:hypothetical protein H2199_005497 [Coniosporium tulheliwenetii]|uniref:Uncharacterized protein n=1 Tax=Coniosporium tulheliwenetii TaxID=3383036 RepID=A0ACC2Z1L7_9PEZI|nr:hypothetical protein H2199_005497 [Cladosporium sp. JES 115]
MFCRATRLFMLEPLWVMRDEGQEIGRVNLAKVVQTNKCTFSYRFIMEVVLWSRRSCLGIWLEVECPNEGPALTTTATWSPTPLGSDFSFFVTAIPTFPPDTEALKITIQEVTTTVTRLQKRILNAGGFDRQELNMIFRFELVDMDLGSWAQRKVHFPAMRDSET